MLGARICILFCLAATSALPDERGYIFLDEKEVLPNTITDGVSQFGIATVSVEAPVRATPNGSLKAEWRSHHVDDVICALTALKPLKKATTVKLYTPWPTWWGDKSNNSKLTAPVMRTLEPMLLDLESARGRCNVTEKPAIQAGEGLKQ